MNIQAEDSRSVKCVDISFFLKKPPIELINPKVFKTDCASGSTSQAAAVAEGLEAGCKLMLFDEDRSANNFMYKDEEMKRIIRDSSTTPYIDIARKLFISFNVSSIIVSGASSEYLKIADCIVLIDKFNAYALESGMKDMVNDSSKLDLPKPRFPDYKVLALRNLKHGISILDHETVRYGREKIKVTDIIPNCTSGQLNFICSFLYYISTCRNVKHLGQSTFKEVDRRKIAERPHRDRIGTAEMDS